MNTQSPSAKRFTSRTIFALSEGPFLKSHISIHLCDPLEYTRMHGEQLILTTETVFVVFNPDHTLNGEVADDFDGAWWFASGHARHYANLCHGYSVTAQVYRLLQKGG